MPRKKRDGIDELDELEYQREDLAEITTLSTSLTGDLFSIYGWEMDSTGDANNKWSKKTSQDDMEYKQADSVTNFRVGGEKPMTQLHKLIPKRKYIGTFELELTAGATGWQEQPFVVELTVPGSKQPIKSNERKRSTAGTAFDLHSSPFELAAAPQKTGNFSFYLSHSGTNTKTGLIIKRFLIQ